MARPRSDIDARILRAAGEHFLRDGVDGASLRAIAQSAGTSVGMVGYYFPTKDALFAAVVERTYVAVLDDLAVALAPDATFERQVARVQARLAAMSDEEFLVVRLVMREVLLASPRTPALLARFSKGHIPLVLAAVTSACARGEVRPEVGPVGAVIAALVPSVAAVLARRLLGGALPAGVPLPDAEALAARVREAVFRGIGPR